MQHYSNCTGFPTMGCGEAMSPDGNVSGGLQIPIVSVRSGGIRWPKRRHFVRHDPGLFTGWRIIAEEVGTGIQTIEARFWRRATAERVARLLNRIEAKAINS